MESVFKTSMKQTRKMPKPNNVVVIPTQLGGLDFFKKWCMFLRPFIKLTDREIDVISSLLMHRFELSKSISDPSILDSMLMSEDIKKKVMEDCHISMQHFYVVMSNLRKDKVIVDNVINPRLLPNIRKDENGMFQLLVLFKQ